MTDETENGRMGDLEMLERLDAASRDDRLADGMLYRQAAERIAEYMGRDVSYWHRIMSRTDKQANRIRDLQDRLERVKVWAWALHDELSLHICGDECNGCPVCNIPDDACDVLAAADSESTQEGE